jgi:hypothetical protein
MNSRLPTSVGFGEVVREPIRLRLLTLLAGVKEFDVRYLLLRYLLLRVRSSR